MLYIPMVLLSVVTALTKAAPLSGTATPFTGDITHYATGLGSCGVSNNDQDPVVALSAKTMNNPPNPNDNPLCGTQIHI